MNARAGIVTSMVIGGLTLVGSSLAKGKMPTSREIFGLGAVYTFIGFGADVNPEATLPLAALATTAVVLVKGGDALNTFSKPNGKNVSLLKAFQKFDAPLTQAASVMGGGSIVGNSAARGAVGSLASQISGAVSAITNYTAGGVGGDWNGSAPIAKAIAAVSGLPVSSEKRDRRTTASGNISDHWTGSTSSYAVDLAATGAVGDAALAKIMRALNHPEYRGGSWFSMNYGNYRIQIGWKVAGHYDHIHVGVRKV